MAYLTAHEYQGRCRYIFTFNEVPNQPIADHNFPSASALYLEEWSISADLGLTDIMLRAAMSLAYHGFLGCGSGVRELVALQPDDGEESCLT